MKLHKQFAHPSADSLKSLIQHADAFDQEIDQLIDQVTKNCVTCKHYKRTRPRPVVCMPIATQFNEVVAMDLKHFRRGIYFLHLIDLHTRFSLAKIIKSKHPSVIVQNVIIMWVANGFATPKSFLLTMVANLPMEVMKKWLNSLMLRFVVQ